MPWISSECCLRYVKSGRTKSIPGISSSGNAIPASTRRMPLPPRTAVIFLPISPKPPRGTTCKVLSLSSSDYLLLQADQPISTSAFVFADLTSWLASVQVPPEVKLLRPDRRKVHVVQIQMLSREAPYVLCSDRLYAVGDLLGCQELRAGYGAPADAVHPGGGALKREQRRAFELLLGSIQLLA